MPLLSIGAAIIGNPWARLIAAVIGAYLFGFYSVEQPDIKALQKVAADGRDIEWQQKLDRLEDQSRKALDAAIEARDHSPPDPVDATVASLCAGDPDCADRGK